VCGFGIIERESEAFFNEAWRKEGGTVRDQRIHRKMKMYPSVCGRAAGARINA